MYSQENHIKTASILIEKKKYNEAKFTLLEIIKDIKNIKIDAKVYYLLFLSCDGLKESKNAKKYLEKCLKANNKNHLVLNNLANIYLKEGNMYKAEKLYLRSLECKKDYLIAIANLAILYQNLGKLEEAKKFYLKAINLSPKKIAIYFNLNRIDKHFIDKKKLEFLADLMKKEKIILSDMAYGFFLLAEYERKQKNFNKEIEYLNNAHQNAFNFELSKNTQTLKYWKNIISKKYDKFKFKNDNTKNILTDFKPIFIIGLPRSGSTITEAVLSSGTKNITALGETSIFNGIIVKEFLNNEISLIDVDLVRNKILAVFDDRNYAIKNKVFIDKSLENFFYIDVILKVFPKAKFINTFRNVEDNIFAIFQQSLSKLSWTHTIENILQYIDNYLKIMKYFTKKYPDKIFLLNLKELTNKPEETSKNLYDFCDFKWNYRALDFYNRKDLLISTASNVQIRKKIENYDHDKYKPYKHLLKNFYAKYNWLNQ